MTVNVCAFANLNELARVSLIVEAWESAKGLMLLMALLQIELIN